MVDDKTHVYSSPFKRRDDKDTLKIVYQALQEKGYDPKRQIIGYLLSEDPTYITNHNNARALISRVDRYELLEEMLETYLSLSTLKP